MSSQKTDEYVPLQRVEYSVFYPGRKKAKCHSFRKPTRDTKPQTRKHKGQMK